MNEVNYDKVAGGYSYRYQRSYNSTKGISKKLSNIAQSNDIRTILEVGCGTGHWLNLFKENKFVVGLDASLGMLSKANFPESTYYLIQGSSNQLPIKENSTDFIYCINAIHHFQQPDQFIKDCRALLNQNGIFVIVCMNPHSGIDDWFIYDYFEGTHKKDLQRYPSPNNLEDWLLKAGFSNVSFQIGERLQNKLIGQDVFPIPKDYTSQLSLLTEQEYETGIKKIKEYIDSAYSKNELPEFNVDISLSMVTAHVYE